MDYIVTKIVGYDFNPSNFELQGDVIKFLSKIFADSAIYEYMFTTLSSYLDGMNREETLSFWPGTSSKQRG